MTVEEGQALTFTASFDTLPAFEPGDYTALTLSGRRAAIEEAAVDAALERLRHGPRGTRPWRRAASSKATRSPSISSDGATRTASRPKRDSRSARRRCPTSRVSPGRHSGVDVELGSGEPPGFDEQILGLEPGATKHFPIRYPADHPIGELANGGFLYRDRERDQAPRAAGSR